MGMYVAGESQRGSKGKSPYLVSFGVRVARREGGRGVIFGPVGWEGSGFDRRRVHVVRYWWVGYVFVMGKRGVWRER